MSSENTSISSQIFNQKKHINPTNLGLCRAEKISARAKMGQIFCWPMMGWAQFGLNFLGPKMGQGNLARAKVGLGLEIIIIAFE